MRPPAGPAARSKTEKIAAGSAPLQAHSQALPRGLSPLRFRLLRLCLDEGSLPDPARLDALRRMTLREALQLEDVSHHRQREGLLLQDALREAAER